MEGYSIAFILFTECYEKCEFCYQKYKRSKISRSDMEFIFSIPNLITKIVSKKDIRDCSIAIGLSGGELFTEDTFMPLYKKIYDDIMSLSILKERNLSIDMKIMTNGMYYKDMEELSKYMNASIDISYDIANRYNDLEYEQTLVLRNISRLIENGIIPTVSMVLTKQNIDKFLESGLPNELRALSINISYFLPMSKWQTKFIPSTEGLAKFFIKAYDEGYHFDTTEYCSYGAIISRYTDIDDLDYCGDRAMINDFCKDDISSIYGNTSEFHKYLDECIYCEYYKECPKMCYYSIKAMLKAKKFYSCPLKRLYQHIRGDKDNA